MKLFTEYGKLVESMQTLTDINTAEFKKWFKNSVITDGGNPTIVYHGTNKNFDSFSTSYLSSNTGNEGHFGAGIYFTYDIREAQTYGNIILECYISMQNPFIPTVANLEKYASEYGYEKEPVAIDKDWLLNTLKSKDPVVYELLNDAITVGEDKAWENWSSKEYPQSPIGLDLNDAMEWLEYLDPNKSHGLGDYTISELRQYLGEPKIIMGYPIGYEPDLLHITDHGRSSQQFTQSLIKDGYDGVIYGTEIVVFEPSQIKSVYNTGNWDSRSDSIYEST